MHRTKKRITKKVIKNADIRMRITLDKKEEIKVFCQEHNITMTDFLEKSIEMMLVR